MESEIFQKIGFTCAEAKTYVALLGMGSVKVGRLIEKTGLQSSTVHNTLHSLQEKGYVNYILQGKMRIYSAVDPKYVLKTLDENKQEFESVLPQLQVMQQSEKQEAEIFIGTNGLMVLLYELIEETKPKDHYFFFAMDVPKENKEIQKFFQRYDAKRKEKKLVVQGIARKELKYLFEKREYIQMKYASFPVPSNIMICNNKMALINWEEKPTGILITSKQIIDTQRQFFKELWKML